MVAAIPPIAPIPTIGSTGALVGTTPIPATTGAGIGANSVSFQNVLGQAIDSLNGITNNASSLSLKAAAGKANVVDATVATTEAELATQLTSAIVSKAVVSLNTIMNMQV